MRTVRPSGLYGCLCGSTLPQILETPVLNLMTTPAKDRDVLGPVVEWIPVTVMPVTSPCSTPFARPHWEQTLSTLMPGMRMLSYGLHVQGDQSLPESMK